MDVITGRSWQQGQTGVFVDGNKEGVEAFELVFSNANEVFIFVFEKQVCSLSDVQALSFLVNNMSLSHVTGAF